MSSAVCRQFGSVQDGYLCIRGKPMIGAPPHLSGVSQMLPLKQFQCWYNCLQTAVPEWDASCALLNNLIMRMIAWEIYMPGNTTFVCNLCIVSLFIFTDAVNSIASRNNFIGTFSTFIRRKLWCLNVLITKG